MFCYRCITVFSVVKFFTLHVIKFMNIIVCKQGFHTPGKTGKNRENYEEALKSKGIIGRTVSTRLQMDGWIYESRV